MNTAFLFCVDEAIQLWSWASIKCLNDNPSDENCYTFVNKFNVAYLYEIRQHPMHWYSTLFTLFSGLVVTNSIIVSLDSCKLIVWYIEHVLTVPRFRFWSPVHYSSWGTFWDWSRSSDVWRLVHAPLVSRFRLHKNWKENFECYRKKKRVDKYLDQFSVILLKYLVVVC